MMRAPDTRPGARPVRISCGPTRENRIAMTPSSPSLKGRDPSLKPTDKSALYAIAQAAIDVELFTIPLYMSTLYSIQGMHEINSQGTSYYKGRLWPGSNTVAVPQTANQ